MSTPGSTTRPSNRPPPAVEAGPTLTVDVGNERAKLVLWGTTAGTPAPSAVSAVEIPTNGELPEAIARFLDEFGPPARAALSTVAEEGLGGRIAALLRARSPRFVYAPAPGLVNRCRVPGEVGLDRLYAARGALELAPAATPDALERAVIVVDVGTAMTVDLARSTRAEAAVFLGGAIAPGPALLARSLFQHAARLPLVEPWTGAPALGQDTRAAIAAGVAWGLRGAARALVEQLLGQAPRASLFLTGGGHRFLLEPEPFVECPTSVEPMLVQRGLLAAAQAVFDARVGP